MPAAGIDLLLPNQNSTTLRFSREFPRAFFTVAVLCDGTVEGPVQSCTLRFSTIAVPEYARDFVIVDAGREAVLDIIECVDECEFAVIQHNLREDTNNSLTSYMQHTRIHTFLVSLPLKGIGQDPGNCLGHVSEANRLSNG